ncbi:TolC family protein [Candidatus Omnitrophota bacterium]
MFKNAGFLIILLLSLSIGLIDAAAEEILSWQDCVTEALKNHPDLASAKAELRQVEIDKALTQSAWLPEITSTLSGKTAKAASATTDTYAYSVSGTQLLFDGFKTTHDLSAASQTIKAQEYNYIVVSSDIRLNLRTAFVELLEAQELISITEEISQRRKQNHELVRLRYEVGREHKGALLTAGADLAQAKLERTQAERDLTLSQRKIIKELGRRQFAPVKAKEDFNIQGINRERPDFEHLTDNTPFLKELVAKKEAARFDLDSARADFFPQVYLNGSTGKTGSDWPPKNDAWSAGVTLSFPIFEGGSRISEVSKARAALEQKQAEERSGRDSVILTLEQTWTELQDALDEILVQEKHLAAVEERARIAGAQYSSGLISFDDWIIIEDNLVDARKSFLNARADALVAEATWIQAEGGALDYEN